MCLYGPVVDDHLTICCVQIDGSTSVGNRAEQTCTAELLSYCHGSFGLPQNRIAEALLVFKSILMIRIYYHYLGTLISDDNSVEKEI